MSTPGTPAELLFIPSGLLLSRYGPDWLEFFNRLGVRARLAPVASRKELDEGSKFVAMDACLPLRAFAGQVVSALKRGERVFLPRIIRLEGGTYPCPKILGAVDIVRAHSDEKGDIIDPVLELPCSGATLAMLALRFTLNPVRIQRAAGGAYRWLKGSHFLPGCQEGSGGTGRTDAEKKRRPLILLMGHPYVLDNETINMGVIELLRRRDVELLIEEGCPAGKEYWAHANEMIDLIERFGKNIDAAIYISCFGCGVDSMLLVILEKMMAERGKPFLPLTVDEHSAEAALVTRLDAFLDILEGVYPGMHRR